MSENQPNGLPFARAGSQRWLQMAVNQSPHVIQAALAAAGAIRSGENIHWRSPLAAEGFREFRDAEALRHLDIPLLPKRRLEDFWPPRGPVWDALGVAGDGTRILVEAKAHIAEAASPGTKATPDSLERIQKALNEARAFYAPRATAAWTGSLYQYANRLAFHYLLNELNGIPSRLVFIDFLNAWDVEGPASEDTWKGATALLHALLGLPKDLTRFGVFHAYVDVRALAPG